MEEKYIYIIPTSDKPIKIAFEGLSCPIGIQGHCKYSEMRCDDNTLNITIECTLKECEMFIKGKF